MLKSKVLSSHKDLIHGFAYEFDGDTRTLSSKIGLKDIRTLKQIHSDKCVLISNEDETTCHKEGDALLTSLEGVGVGVRTADCIPILFCNQKKVVGAIHAGWRGTLNEISFKTIDFFGNEFNSDPSEIVCTIGPSIGRCCYEVKEDVVNDFKEKFSDSDDYLIRNKNNEFFLDLKLANFIQLKKAGVEKIDDINMCTKCNIHLPSYRREGNNSGRILSFIGRV